MNYLGDLVSTLHKDEIEKTKDITAGKREKEVLDLFLDAAKKKRISSVSPAALNITQSHFDKVCSVLIEKILAAVTDGSFYAIAQYLVKKGLSRLLLHEIKIKQRQIAKSKGTAQKREFYLHAFEAMRKLSFDILDLKLLKQYVNYLTPLLKENEPYSKTVLALRYVHIENAYHFLNGKGLAYRAKALSNIQTAVPDPEKLRHQTAYAHYHFCMAGYYKDFVDDQEKAQFHAQKALKSALQWPAGTDDGFLSSCYGINAVVLSNRSRFNEALKVYREAYAKLPHEMQASYYHLFMYAATAMVCGELELLESHLETRMKPFMESNSALYYRLEAMRLYALLYLYQDRLQEALVIIRELQGVKRKLLTDTADIFLRIIDNVYALLNHDWELSLALMRKNVRFLNRKGYTFDNCDYLHFFQTIALIAKAKKQLKKVREEDLAPHLAFSRRGYMKMYGGLLDKVID